MRTSLPKPFCVILTAFALGMVAVLCGVGGDDPSRISLAGTVSLDGAPLEGTIRFVLVSDSDRPHVDVSLIEHGEYAIPSSDSLVPGTYLVQIRTYAQEATTFSHRRIGDQPRQAPNLRVPSRYNEQSVLRVKIERGGLSKFDFDLKG